MAELVESRYNFRIQIDDGRVGLYNSKTGAVIVAEGKQAEELLAVLNRPQDHTESSFLPTLKAQGFLVDKDTNELADIRTWHTTYLNDQRVVHLTMLPAEACNFACPYCFQYQKRQILMQPWVYEAVLRMLERIIVSNYNLGEKTHIKISWFGGEPTLAAHQILAFQQRLKELCKKSPVVIRSALVTNGYLLTPRLFQELWDAGIHEFQVTLDGDKPTHDRLRVLKTKKPTFDIIYTNLKGISTLPRSFQFKLAVRVNFLRTTVSSVYSLLDKFVKDFGNDERFSIYCRPVYNFPTMQNTIQDVAPDICTLEEGLALQNLFAMKVMESLRLSSLTRMFDPLPMPAPAWCPNERRYSYVVGADGLLFPCDTFVGSKEYSIGYLSKDGTIVYDEKHNKWKRSLFDSSENPCLECKLLPICMGGCKRIRISTPYGTACFWREEDILSALREYIKLRDRIGITKVSKAVDPSQESLPGKGSDEK